MDMAININVYVSVTNYGDSVIVVTTGPKQSPMALSLSHHYQATVDHEHVKLVDINKLAEPTLTAYLGDAMGDFYNYKYKHLAGAEFSLYNGERCC